MLNSPSLLSLFCVLSATGSFFAVPVFKTFTFIICSFQGNLNKLLLAEQYLDCFKPFFHLWQNYPLFTAILNCRYYIVHSSIHSFMLFSYLFLILYLISEFPSSLQISLSLFQSLLLQSQDSWISLCQILMSLVMGLWLGRVFKFR